MTGVCHPTVIGTSLRHQIMLTRRESAISLNMGVIVVVVLNHKETMLQNEAGTELGNRRGVGSTVVTGEIVIDQGISHLLGAAPMLTVLRDNEGDPQVLQEGKLLVPICLSCSLADHWGTTVDCSFLHSLWFSAFRSSVFRAWKSLRKRGFSWK